jgi:hypothetical protein
VPLLCDSAEVVQEVIGQCDSNMRPCAEADARSATSVAVLAMSVIHPCSSDEQISRKRAEKRLNSRFPRFGTL